MTAAVAAPLMLAQPCNVSFTKRGVYVSKKIVQKNRFLQSALSSRLRGRRDDSSTVSELAGLHKALYDQKPRVTTVDEATRDGNRA